MSATPIPPPPSLRPAPRDYDRQAGPVQWLFQGPPAESKFLRAKKSQSCSSLAKKPVFLKHLLSSFRVFRAFRGSTFFFRENSRPSKKNPKDSRSRVSSHQRHAKQPYFPALRSGRRLVLEPSPQKQFLSNQSLNQTNNEETHQDLQNPAHSFRNALLPSHPGDGGERHLFACDPEGGAAGR